MYRSGNPIAGIVAAGISLTLLSFAALADGHADVEDAAMVAKGKTLFDQNCAVCHGADLKGPPNPADFKIVPPRLDGREGHASHHGDGHLYDQVARGSRDKDGQPVDGGMPAFGDILKKDEIRTVIGYIKSQWPEDARRRQPGAGHGHH